MTSALPGRRSALAEAMTFGFGTTVAMWAVAYVARLPFVLAPAPAVLAGLLVALLAGGFLAGASGGRGFADGLAAGAVSGALNLLVLGSLLSAKDRPNALVPTAALWVPGSILLAALLAGAGAAVGARRVRPPRALGGVHAFACVAAAATALLLVAGGLVTSNKAGLAVVDWPNSYGYNMFLYPFARMVGGIYYEHAHRLLGALVGLTTTALAVLLFVEDDRTAVKRWGLAAVGLVAFQAVLGGLRVTGKPTLATDPALTEPNVYLAVAHGVTAPIFFSLVVALATVTSRAWRTALPTADPGARGERRMAAIAVGLVVVQIALGAVQRHLAAGLALHVTMALLVAGHVISCGARAWGLHGDDAVLRRAGIRVIAVTALQFALGVAAWAARTAAESGAIGSGLKVAATTAHQGTGAILLASVVVLRLQLGQRIVLPSASQPRSL